MADTAVSHSIVHGPDSPQEADASSRSQEEARLQDAAPKRREATAAVDDRIDETEAPIPDPARPSCLGALPPFNEAMMYVVALFCGVSIMLPTNAVFSAPNYIMHFYKYAMHDEHTIPQHPNFWNNSLTYYSLFNMVVCLVMEPLTLTRRFRQIPILPRLLGGLCVLMLEVILLLTVPAGGTTEGGAIATLCFAGLISGLGKSIFESTAYGVFGAFPASVTSTLMGGVGVSGVLTSLIQIIVKGALGDGYEKVVTQSHIYYGLDLGIQCCTFVLVLLLRWNAYAQRQLGGLAGRGPDSGDGAETAAAFDHPPATSVASPVEKLSPEPVEGVGEEKPMGNDAETASRNPREEGDPTQIVPVDTQVTRHRSRRTSAVSSAKGTEGLLAAGPIDAEALPETTPHGRAELLMATNLRDTLRKIAWMFIACGFNFLVTLLLFPTVSVSADSGDYWYGTLAVFIFNVCDVLGRFSPSFKPLWPRTYGQRYWIVAASAARAVFLPLLILYSYHYISGHAYGYVMMALFGYTNGAVGSFALIFGPMSRGITDEGQRFVAGTMMGISILIGGTVGMVCSIIMQAVRGS